MSMLYRQQGRAGLVVSRLAYGAMTFTIGSVGLLLSAEELALPDAASPQPSLYPMNFIDAIVDPETAALARKPGDPA
jgi:hypothetical protein